MTETVSAPEFVFKIFRPDEWDSFSEAGRYVGSADDARDGFIHLSCQEQLQGTLDKHYHAASEVVIARVRSADLNIVMEVSRGGQRFPHLYGELPMSAVEDSERKKL